MLKSAIKCDQCKHDHPAIFMKTKQALGCAADVFIQKGKVIVLGSFGSKKFDGQMLEIIGDSKAHVKLGTICDDCLSQLVEKGDAIKTSDPDFFGWGND